MASTPRSSSTFATWSSWTAWVSTRSLTWRTGLGRTAVSFCSASRAPVAPIVHVLRIAEEDKVEVEPC
jgi:hypothetical protein